MTRLIFILLLLASQISAQNLAVVQSYTPGTGSTSLPGLGFGGEVIAKFQFPVSNEAGKDVFIEEASALSGRRWPEKVRVYFSQDGCNWIYSKEITQSDSVEIRLLNKIQWIRLIDSSNPNFAWAGETTPNGYDLMSITADNSTSPGFSTTLVSRFPCFVSFAQGLRKDGSPVEAARSNALNSLLEPQGVDQGYNFLSLGMGGWASYSFVYAIFDGPGVDISIVETSWGSPTCQAWPESAFVEGAYNIDGPYVFLGQICQDGSIDIANSGINGFNYVRVTDRTPAQQFDGNADGYDIDGLIAVHQCALPQNANNAREEMRKELETSPVSKNSDYYVVKNFYGVVMKEGSGEPNLEGLKPGAYVLEFTNEGSLGRKMVIVQPDTR
jgi:hypothetical protein